MVASGVKGQISIFDKIGVSVNHTSLRMYLLLQFSSQSASIWHDGLQVVAEYGLCFCGELVCRVGVSTHRNGRQFGKLWKRNNCTAFILVSNSIKFCVLLDNYKYNILSSLTFSEKSRFQGHLPMSKVQVISSSVWSNKTKRSWKWFFINKREGSFVSQNGFCRRSG